MNLNLSNAERILLLKLINKDIIKGQIERSPSVEWNGKHYIKKAKEYGLTRMTRLFELESKLKNKK